MGDRRKEKNLSKSSGCNAEKQGINEIPRKRSIPIIRTTTELYS